MAYRSMRDYEEFHEDASFRSVFFVANYQNFTIESLKKIHEILLLSNQFISLEKLYKGSEKVLVIFGPGELRSLLPQLNLIELEDYISETGLKSNLNDEDSKKVGPDEILSWSIESKRDTKREVRASEELKNLRIGEDQKVFLQAVLQPIGIGSELIFQSTLRIMVADHDSANRVELAKKIERIFSQSTGLIKHTDEFIESKKFESFRQRTLIPKEVVPFSLSASEVLDIFA